MPRAFGIEAAHSLLFLRVVIALLMKHIDESVARTESGSSLKDVL
jgi:hypothetical protein